jgi:hypothetical protein
MTTDISLPDFPIGVAQGVAAIALNMAMKYYEMNTVTDGALYQQYKIEGKNFQDLSLVAVFETAKEIEIHLMGASDRIAQMVVDAIVHGETEE